MLCAQSWTSYGIAPVLWMFKMSLSYLLGETVNVGMFDIVGMRLRHADATLISVHAGN